MAQKNHHIRFWAIARTSARFTRLLRVPSSLAHGIRKYNEFRMDSRRAYVSYSTARVWKNFQQIHELRGHSGSVWAVLAVDEDQTLTGSADKTIALWQGNKLVHRYAGHADAVRGLSVLPEGIDIGFASCSNDGTLRLWTLGGDVLHQFDGHTSFVYSMASIPETGSLISSGEDRTARVWEGVYLPTFIFRLDTKALHKMGSSSRQSPIQQFLSGQLRPCQMAIS